MDVLNFHGKVAATGLSVKETVSDMMCKEFFNCKPQPQADSSKEDTEKGDEEL